MVTFTAADVIEGMGVWLTVSWCLVLAAHATGVAFGFAWVRLLSRVLQQ